MTADEELWAETSAIMARHGDRAIRWVAERTVALNFKGDVAGVRRYHEIAVRLDELQARVDHAPGQDRTMSSP